MENQKKIQKQNKKTRCGHNGLINNNKTLIMANLTYSTKQNKLAFLKGIHQLFMCDMNSFDDNIEVMLAHMINYNVHFLPKEEINGSDYWTASDAEEHFFDTVNSEGYNEAQRLYRLCEEYMDMSECGTIRQRISAELNEAGSNKLFTSIPQVRIPEINPSTRKSA